jgi:hypothetical protein
MIDAVAFVFLTNKQHSKKTVAVAILRHWLPRLGLFKMKFADTLRMIIRIGCDPKRSKRCDKGMSRCKDLLKIGSYLKPLSAYRRA